MRFLSSVALEKTPRLRFAASCSAAEAMKRPSSVAALVHLSSAKRERSALNEYRVRVLPAETQLASASLTSRTTVVVTDPPAFCTASIAAADAPDTVIVTA